MSNPFLEAVETNERDGVRCGSGLRGDAGTACGHCGVVVVDRCGSRMRRRRRMRYGTSAAVGWGSTRSVIAAGRPAPGEGGYVR
ncbi:hypothetical protein GCM10023068_12030 [Leifsonia shinshuensis]